MNKKWCVLLWFMCCLLRISSCDSGIAHAGQVLDMQVGEVMVLNHKDVERVAVGDGQVLNAVTTEDKELILFARQQGSSGLQVWTQTGKIHHYQVQVAAENARQSLQELKHVLERIPHLQVSQAGDKLVLEGERISDEDRERLNMLGQHYPQLLDFTSQMGCETLGFDGIPEQKGESTWVLHGKPQAIAC